MNAIILTGGESSRFGSDKSEAVIANRTLLEHVADQLSDCSLIIVGPTSSITAQYVQEDPIGGGPVAGIAAGIESVKSERVAIYAVDTPFAPYCRCLLEAAFEGDGVVAVDGEGYSQYLGGIYKSESLRAVLQGQSELSGQSVRKLFSKLNLVRVEVPQPELLMDIDTREDLAKAREIYDRITK